MAGNSSRISENIRFESTPVLNATAIWSALLASTEYFIILRRAFSISNEVGMGSVPFLELKSGLLLHQQFWLYPLDKRGHTSKSANCIDLSTLSRTSGF